VSMGAEISGMLRLMERVRRVEVSASAGMTPLRRGRSRTSSKVMPSKRILAAAEKGAGALVGGAVRGAWVGLVGAGRAEGVDEVGVVVVRVPIP
jgi:hypothetical protein